MDFIRNNARAIIVTLLAAGVVTAISVSGNDTTTDTAQETASTTTAESQAETPTTPEAPTPAEGTEATKPAPQEVVKNEGSYNVVAVEGDNQTKLMRQVIANYQEETSTELSAEQKLFVETTLVNALPRKNLIYVGDTVQVSESQMKNTIEAAKNLSAAQIAAWGAYL